MEKNLLEINDFLEKVQEEIVNLSKKGEVKFTFPRYEDGVNKAYVSEIEYFFKIFLSYTVRLRLSTSGM